MNTKKLSWEDIRKEYDGQWVHLIDYDWNEGTPYPNSGVVHIHAKTRKEFNELIKNSDRIPGARIYVGDVKETGNALRMGCLVVTQHADH
jgi:hypothetical protein